MIVQEKAPLLCDYEESSATIESSDKHDPEMKDQRLASRSKWQTLGYFSARLFMMICLIFFLNLYPGKYYHFKHQPDAQTGTTHSKTLAEHLSQAKVNTQASFNSFDLPKRAFIVKLKVKYSVTTNEVILSQPAHILHIGETPFRKSFLNKTVLGINTFEASSDYVNNKLHSQLISLNGEVLFSKYPVIREPPFSYGMLAEDLQVKDYIYEYVGVCPHLLLQHIIIQEKLNLSELDKNMLVNWTEDSKMKIHSPSKNKPPQYELINIVNNGPPENRIDVVFMGDGYTEEERDKFINDITRLSTEMFEGDTFKSWLPLINVWAVFVPSSESGIGSGGKPKETPFGLYRDGTELRGIYTSKPDTARTICNHLGHELCDFPSMIANDDFYGGLGGEYIISTRSILSGTVVLRHEMGHTFNDVGEEYDGGEVYEGANASPKLSQIPWKHWLTDFSHDHQVIDLGSPKKIKEEKNALAVQDYSWHDLSKKGPYILNFNSSGKYSRWYIQISTSGMDKEGSFKAYLDDKELPWEAPGTIDRTFSTWFNGTHGLSKGSHQLRFEAKKGLPEGEIIHQLCNVEMMEYAKEGKFGWDNPQRVGAYPTYNYKKKKTYRPTNEFCLMRNMTSHHFCPVCTESLWLKFLDRISLLDELDIHLVKLPKSHMDKQLVTRVDQTHMTTFTKDVLAEPQDKKRTLGYFVEAKLINLAPTHNEQSLNPNPSLPKYTLHWFYNGNQVKQLDNESSFIVPDVSPYAKGIWELSVVFSTPQVRKDPNHILSSKETFILKRAY